MDISDWLDYPATFKEMVEEDMLTKDNKKWSYPVVVSEETVLKSFLLKFDPILGPARIHIMDGYWQDRTFSQLFENGSTVIPFNLLNFSLYIEIFPPNAALIHDDWSTNLKLRTSENLTAAMWRKAKDAGLMNFLLHFISGKSDDGGFTFDEHVLHFLCDVASTETVASCLNFSKVVPYIINTAKSKFKYDVKLIIRWTDGTSKQYKNVGNAGFEKHLCIKYNIMILHCFFPTNWGKGKIDLLGGIVHRLYGEIVRLLKEKANKLNLVVGKMNELYQTPGNTVAESMLTTRLFFYVSKEENDIARDNRTSWLTLKFPTGVTSLNFIIL